MKWLCMICDTRNPQRVHVIFKQGLCPGTLQVRNDSRIIQVLYIKSFEEEQIIFTFSNWYSFPAPYNYVDSCEQGEEDERLGEWLFGAEWTRFMAVGADSVPLVRCGRCVPNTRPQGFSLGPRFHHGVPYSDYGSAPLPLYLHSATTVLACLLTESQSYTSTAIAWESMRCSSARTDILSV